MFSFKVGHKEEAKVVRVGQNVPELRSGNPRIF